MLDHPFEIAFDPLMGVLPFGVVAPALIVLLMYALHRTCLGKIREDSVDDCRERANLSTDLRSVESDRSLLRLENQILREFISQTDDNRAIDLLLRRFMPNPNGGFVALFQSINGNLRMVKSRGLNAASQNGLRLDTDSAAEMLDKLVESRIEILEDGRLFHSPMLGQLSKEDRQKVGHLFLVAIGDAGELDGVLITTSLCPVGVPRTQQIEMTVQLMTSIAGGLRRMATLELQQDQLELKKEMLELRAITDRKYDDPTRMVENFLDRLVETIGAHRAAMYLWRQDEFGSHKALVRCGIPLQPAIDTRWSEHEDVVARVRLHANATRILQQDELRQCGVDTLIASALVAPLLKNQRAIGIVCFTSGSPMAVSDSQQSLVRWASEFLADKMRRAFAEVAVERQAQQDGLTQLANRRTFDRRIRHELEHVRKTGHECSLLLCDLDNFKLVNDTYGHPAGDEVLRVSARLMSDEIAKIRTTDHSLIARYGGEEMAVLLPGFGVEGARRIGESIRAAIAATSFRSGSHSFHVTTSVGVAACPEQAATVEHLIAAADAALYQAKQSGRNRVCCAAEVLV